MSPDNKHTITKNTTAHFDSKIILRRVTFIDVSTALE